MSLPQPIRPGATWHVTQRCIERRFYTLPWQNVVSTIKFCLADCASEYPGIRIHAACFLSNHFHVVFTDTHGDMPAFMRDFNSMTGRAVGRLLKKREGIWRKKTYDRVDLKDAGAITDAIVYTLANAVAAGLVAKHSQWPGLHSTPQDLRGGGREFTARATGPFFSKRIKSGDDVRKFRVVAPSVAKVGMNPDDYAEHIAQRLRAVEKDVAANMAELGRKVLGAENAGLVKLGSQPSTPDDPIGKLKPSTCHQEPRSAHRGHQGAAGVPRTIQGSLARLLRGRS